MMVGDLDLGTLRIIIAIIMLAIASILDIWKREVNDILWVGFGAVAIAIIFAGGDVFSSLGTVAISMIIAPIALVAWRLGVFGGADAFCLIVLGGLAPMATMYGSIVTPITTLTNAAILSCAPLFANLCRNLFAISRKQEIFEGFSETRLNKIIAALIGYRAENPRHGFAIERTEGGVKKLDLGLRHAEKAQFCTQSKTWITPSIPYLVYIAGGFAIQVFYGDIIVSLLRGH